MKRPNMKKNLNFINVSLKYQIYFLLKMEQIKCGYSPFVNYLKNRKIIPTKSIHANISLKNIRPNSNHNHSHQ